MKKILLSVAVIAFAGTAVAGLTGAFYKDVETSRDNTFTAGSLDLLVDNVSHYDGMVCALNPDYTEGSALPEYIWIDDDSAHGGPSTYPELLGEPCGGTWEEANLGAHQLFYFTDLKPGDFGEDTLSLHVYKNDAWARIRIENAVDSDNGCTEPELVEEPGCTDNGDGELDDNIERIVWLDQGKIPGFQCGDPELVGPCIDEYEGDNLWLEETEPEISIDGVVILDPITNLPIGMQYELWTTLTDAYAHEGYCETTAGTNPNGHNDYGVCHGLALDGRFVESTTYYIGVEWDFDINAGNEVQTDTLVSDVSFDVVQHRNNPGKTF